MKQCQEEIVIADIECLLKNFLCKKDIDEFIYSLEVSEAIQNAKLFRPSKNIVQNKQSYIGLKLKELTKSIITFAEGKVSTEYLLKLMLDLIHLMILKKAFKHAAEISEDLIIKIGGNQKYSVIELEVYLALAEVAWNLEHWEQSEKYVEKSYEIYHVNEAAGNEMNLPNTAHRYSNQFQQIEDNSKSNCSEKSNMGYYFLIKAKSYIDELLAAQSN